jgi:hypothetical protein
MVVHHRYSATKTSPMSEDDSLHAGGDRLCKIATARCPSSTLYAIARREFELVVKSQAPVDVLWMIPCRMGLLVHDVARPG